MLKEKQTAITEEIRKTEELTEEQLTEVTGGSLGLIVGGWIVLNVAVQGTAYALSKHFSKK